MSSDSQETPAFGPVTDCWYLTGPTAAGKSKVAIALAERLDAEIISLDSMAIYRGMNIGTAKPANDDRAKVPHHLLDIVDPNLEFSLAEYVERAHQSLSEVKSRGKEVLFVGGTPLYLKSMLRGIYTGPPADWDFRKKVDEEAEKVGLELLHTRLQQVDPLSAEKLHPHDKRRIIRALEVHHLTGQPISHLQVQFDDAEPAENCRVFVLGWPRAVLHARIERRIDEMFAKGLVAEVTEILAKYGSLSRTAMQAVGYREVVDMLASEGDLDSTVQLVKSRTRQFARRQETWFRSLEECQRVMLGQNEFDPDEIAAEILKMQSGTA